MREKKDSGKISTAAFFGLPAKGYLSIIPHTKSSIIFAAFFTVLSQDGNFSKEWGRRERVSF